jgi:hypothetical protein
MEAVGGGKGSKFRERTRHLGRIVVAIMSEELALAQWLVYAPVLSSLFTCTTWRHI